MKRFDEVLRDTARAVFEEYCKNGHSNVRFNDCTEDITAELNIAKNVAITFHKNGDFDIHIANAYTEHSVPFTYGQVALEYYDLKRGEYERITLANNEHLEQLKKTLGLED